MAAKEAGLTRQIGISNFPIALMKEAIAAVGAENIATNQIELHRFCKIAVVEFAKQQGIHITSYMTLAYGEALKEQVIKQIAQKHQATPAQVLGVGTGTGLCRDPLLNQRENRQQYGGAGSETGCGRHGADRRAGSSAASGQPGRPGTRLGLILRASALHAPG